MFVSALLLVAIATSDGFAATKVFRVGWLNPGSAQSHGPLFEAFRVGMREQGYVEGRDLVIEQRWANGKVEDLRRLAHELAALRVDVIVTASTPGTEAAKSATTTIPVVSAVIGTDPVAAGFVASLARPGGNLTGLSTLVEDLIPKLFEILHLALPKAHAVAVLSNPTNPWSGLYWRNAQEAARTLGIKVTRVDAGSPQEIERAFEQMAKLRPDAALVFADPFMVAQRVQIVGLASKNRLPVIYPFSVFAQTGGLLSYGVKLSENYRRSARFVDRILRGARPGDLPVELPTSFELVANLRTAKALNIAFPQELLLQATETIE